jgi:hypothetical protein
MTRKKSQAQLDREITAALAKPRKATPSLAERAKAKGHEPETEEGGRAMMQSFTMADIAKLKPVSNRLERGTPVVVEHRLIAGKEELRGIVTWDNGRGSVDVKIPSYGNRIVTTQKSPSGTLHTYNI